MQSDVAKPNVIVILSDDQGYGDFGCNGNPWLNTPNLDRLMSEGVSLKDFHTSPMCAPTRAGLMSGMYPDRVGVWSTLNGRFIMRKETIAMSQTFKDAGYRTGMFGKWHLGDNFPYRPQDKGFEKVLSFGGGVIGEVPDYWDNDYFDDSYLVDGKLQSFDGYCTDIWFENAIGYIEACVKEETPFFVYLANNAPHNPFNVDSKYSNKYEAMSIPVQRARYYGMIENIDENFGKLDDALEKLGVRSNTIVVYFGDNGTSGGAIMDGNGFLLEGYNANLRGKKCDAYEGGHKNGCFFRWPDGQINGGYEVNGLSTNMDIYPTLMDLCRIPNEKGITFDGMSIAKDLVAPNSTIEDRTLIIHNMQLEQPEKYKDYCVLTNNWRLVRTRTYGHDVAELYDFHDDISQCKDLAGQRTDIVNQLNASYENWWENISESYTRYSSIQIGSHKESVTKLTSHTWHGSVEMSYDQTHIRNGIEDCGYWVIDILKSGTYRIELRRWPIEAETPLRGSVEAIIDKQFVHNRNAGKVYVIDKAGVEIQGANYLCSVSEFDKEAVFVIELQEGTTILKAWFDCEDGQRIGAYYAYIQKAITEPV